MMTINLGRTMENPYMFMLCPFFSRICSRRKPTESLYLSTDKICCWPDALTTTVRTVGHGVVPDLISHVSCSARMQGLKDTRES